MSHELLKRVNSTLKDKIRERKEGETREKNIGWLSIMLDSLGDKIVNGLSNLKQPTPQVTVQPPEVNVTVPEVKVPQINVPEIKIPQIKVPEAKVTVDIPEIKIPDIKIPEIKVPQPKVTVNVGKPDTPLIPPIEIPEIVMPDEMTVKAEKALPVVLHDGAGKPYVAGSSSGGGGGANIGKLSQKIEDSGDDIVGAIEQSKDFFLKVALGLINGFSRTAFGSTNENLQLNTEETIWQQGGLHTYLSSDTPLFVSSSDVGDSQTVVVVGLDENLNPVNRLSTLNGQNQVALNADMFRIFIVSILGTKNSGDVYVSEEATGGDLVGGVPQTSSKIKAKVLAERGSSTHAFYTVPAGKIAYISNLEGSVSKVGDTNIFFKFRGDRTGDFLFQPPFPIYESTFSFLEKGFKLDEGNEVELSAKSKTEGTQVSAAFQVILIDA